MRYRLRHLTYFKIHYHYTSIFTINLILKLVKNHHRKASSVLKFYKTHLMKLKSFKKILLIAAQKLLMPEQ